MPDSTGVPRRAANRPPRAAPPRRSRALWIAGGALLLAGLVFGAAQLLGGAKQERQEQEERAHREAPAMSMAELGQRWAKDSGAFDKQFKGEVIAVQGVLARSEEVEGAYGSGTQRVLRLAGPDGLELACWFGAEQSGQVTGLAPGASLTVTGRWSGEGSSSQELVLRFCRLR